jgi:hypothetical protein
MNIGGRDYEIVYFSLMAVSFSFWALFWVDARRSFGESNSELTAEFAGVVLLPVCLLSNLSVSRWFFQLENTLFLRQFISKYMHPSIRHSFSPYIKQSADPSVNGSIIHSFIQSISTSINKQNNLPITFDSYRGIVELSAWPISPILLCHLSSVHCEAHTP